MNYEKICWPGVFALMVSLSLSASPLYGEGQDGVASGARAPSIAPIHLKCNQAVSGLVSTQFRPVKRFMNSPETPKSSQRSSNLNPNLLPALLAPFKLARFNNSHWHLGSLVGREARSGFVSMNIESVGGIEAFPHYFFGVAEGGEMVAFSHQITRMSDTFFVLRKPLNGSSVGNTSSPSQVSHSPTFEIIFQHDGSKPAQVAHWLETVKALILIRELSMGALSLEGLGLKALNDAQITYLKQLSQPAAASMILDASMNLDDPFTRVTQLRVIKESETPNSTPDSKKEWETLKHPSEILGNLWPFIKRRVNAAYKPSEEGYIRAIDSISIELVQPLTLDSQRTPGKVYTRYNESHSIVRGLTPELIAGVVAENEAEENEPNGLGRAAIDSLFRSGR